jgi:hypothetical protein
MDEESWDTALRRWANSVWPVREENLDAELRREAYNHRVKVVGAVADLEQGDGRFWGLW